jgi:hypothetical protein
MDMSENPFKGLVDMINGLITTDTKTPPVNEATAEQETAKSELELALTDITGGEVPTFTSTNVPTGSPARATLPRVQKAAIATVKAELPKIRVNSQQYGVIMASLNAAYSGVNSWNASIFEQETDKDFYTILGYISAALKLIDYIEDMLADREVSTTE